MDTSLLEAHAIITILQCEMHGFISQTVLLFTKYQLALYYYKIRNFQIEQGHKVNR